MLTALTALLPTTGPLLWVLITVLHIWSTVYVVIVGVAPLHPAAPAGGKPVRSSTAISSSSGPCDPAGEVTARLWQGSAPALAIRIGWCCLNGVWWTPTRTPPRRTVRLSFLG